MRACGTDVAPLPIGTALTCLDANREDNQAMSTIGRWTGHEARALRLSLRLSVRAFAEHLGIAARTISKWEKAGKA